MRHRFVYELDELFYGALLNEGRRRAWEAQPLRATSPMASSLGRHLAGRWAWATCALDIAFTFGYYLVRARRRHARTLTPEQCSSPSAFRSAVRHHDRGTAPCVLLQVYTGTAGDGYKTWRFHSYAIVRPFIMGRGACLALAVGHLAFRSYAVRWSPRRLWLGAISLSLGIVGLAALTHTVLLAAVLETSLSARFEPTMSYRPTRE